MSRADFSLTQSGSPRLMAIALVAALIACWPVQMQADRIALHFTANGSGGTSNVTVGWAFSLSKPVLLSELGAWAAPFHGGGGLRESRPVTVWDDTGTIVEGRKPLCSLIR